MNSSRSFTAPANSRCPESLRRSSRKSEMTASTAVPAAAGLINSEAILWVLMFLRYIPTLRVRRASVIADGHTASPGRTGRREGRCVRKRRQGGGPPEGATPDTAARARGPRGSSAARLTGGRYGSGRRVDAPNPQATSRCEGSGHSRARSGAGSGDGTRGRWDAAFPPRDGVGDAGPEQGRRGGGRDAGRRRASRHRGEIGGPVVRPVSARCRAGGSGVRAEYGQRTRAGTRTRIAFLA